MNGTLYLLLDNRGKRIDKPKPIEVIAFVVNKDRNAYAWKDGDFVATKPLSCVTVEIYRDGIFVKGLEGAMQNGVKTFRYQEWMLKPDLADEKKLDAKGEAQ